MASNNSKAISIAKPHTLKKFELIENYIETWAQKLLNTNACNGLIFIDCMCSSGVYKDVDGNKCFGTPIKVARVLRDAAFQYRDKQIYLYFNDNSQEKIDVLKQNLPDETTNFHFHISVGDGNDLLKDIGPKLSNNNHLHYFLLYDPYDASIDWEALAPFFRYWGEVMINHMIMDPTRAITQVKTESAKKKYSDTYLEEFEKLVPYGSNREAYEKRIEFIINTLKGNRRYYVAAVPFFNTQNTLIYNLIHCTSNDAGFQLYKKTAWKTFGAKSSLKNTHGKENQLSFDMLLPGTVTIESDDYCLYVQDIAAYLQKCFAGRQNVTLGEMWNILKPHPIFPSDGYRKEIRKILKDTYGAKETVMTKTIGKKETVVSFSGGSGICSMWQDI